MIAVYVNDFSITKFYEYLVVLKEHNINSKDLRFYNSGIYEDDFIINSNLLILINDIKNHKINKVIIFSLDKLNTNDINLIKETARESYIPFVVL